MLLSVGKDGLIEEKLTPTCCHVVFPRTIYDGNRPLVCVVITITDKKRVLISLWLYDDCGDEADDNLITEAFQNQSMWNCDGQYAFPWVGTNFKWQCAILAHSQNPVQPVTLADTYLQISLMVTDIQNISSFGWNLQSFRFSITGVVSVPIFGVPLDLLLQDLWSHYRV